MAGLSRFQNAKREIGLISALIAFQLFDDGDALLTHSQNEKLKQAKQNIRSRVQTTTLRD